MTDIIFNFDIWPLILIQYLLICKMEMTLIIAPPWKACCGIKKDNVCREFITMPSA